MGNMVDETYYVYGMANGSLQTTEEFKTSQETYDAAIDDMRWQVINGYDVYDDYFVYEKHYKSEHDDTGLMWEKHTSTRGDRVRASLVNNMSHGSWTCFLDNVISNKSKSFADDLRDADRFYNKIVSCYHRNLIEKSDCEYLFSRLQDVLPIREIVSGKFEHGEKVTLNIGGNIVTRKVHFASPTTDVYVINDHKYYKKFEFDLYEALDPLYVQ